MEWLLFIVAVLMIPSEHKAGDDLSENEKRDRQWRHLAAGVFAALGVTMRIFYMNHGG